MAIAMAVPNSLALSQKPILTLTPQIHPAKSYKYNCSKDGYGHKYRGYSCNTQLIDTFKHPKRIVCAWCSHEDRIEEDDPGREAKKDKDAQDPGVEVALAMLTFYRREISPLLPSSCRYVPSCSEYSMQAYKRYGFVKGTVLTAWRLCRCNPLGGSGFDPPRWFDESKPPSP